MQKNLELIIIGAGPAGLSASIYASRYGIKNQVIGGVTGGQISGTHLIDNYPGIEDVSGHEFGQRLAQHAKKYGAEIIADKVIDVTKEKDFFIVRTENGQEFEGKAILLATGTKHRKLGIPGEEKFFGKGVSYCATCDGFFYKNKKVAVVGGSDSAAAAAVFLSGIARDVYIVYRKSQLRAELYWQKIIETKANIRVIYNTNLLTIEGEGMVKKIVLDKKYEDSDSLEVDGLFVEAGSDPNADLGKAVGVELDEDGYIKTGSDMKTSIEGVWAAGDITDGSDKFRQVVTATAEGAIAARSIHQFLQKARKV